MQCRERIGYAIEENERGPRHTAQTAERRGEDLQQRRRRLAVETDEVR